MNRKENDIIAPLCKDEDSSGVDSSLEEVKDKSHISTHYSDEVFMKSNVMFRNGNSAHDSGGL
jgi:hypothetical protein